jgi:hypothetical protein
VARGCDRSDQSASVSRSRPTFPFASIATTEEVSTTRVTPAACAARSARSVPSTAGRISSSSSFGGAIGKGEAVWTSAVDARHRLGPAGVAREVEFDEGQPVERGGVVRCGRRPRAPRRPARGSGASRGRCARFQKVERDALGDEPGDSGEKDGLGMKAPC